MKKREYWNTLSLSIQIEINRKVFTENNMGELIKSTRSNIITNTH